MRAAAEAYAARAGIAFQALQIRAYFRCALVAQVAVFLHAFVNYLREFDRERGIQANRIDGIFVQDFVEDSAGSFTFEWENAGGHFVEYAGKGEEVAARVELFAENLFGRHV